mgnify:CR=1 FL=1
MGRVAAAFDAMLHPGDRRATERPVGGSLPGDLNQGRGRPVALPETGASLPCRAAVERGLSVMSAFRPGDRFLTLAELSERTGLYKSTILRLIQTLRTAGYLEQSDEGFYYIGATVFRLGRCFQDAMTPAEIILAEEVAERTWSAMERTNAEAAQRQSEERLSQFTNASSDVLWIRDAATMECEFLSPAFEKVYGVDRESMLGETHVTSWSDLIVPEDREEAWQYHERARNGERVAFDYRIRRPSDGQIRWLRSTAFPMFDNDGHVQRIGGINHDWTALKKAQEHQQLLTAELQHRVRNTLSVIRSIARRTAQTSETVEDYAMHLDGRIGAFARVQAAVTRDPTAGIDLGLLVADTLLAATARENDQVSIDGPQLGLQPKAAETLGLAIHELATNAVKYGALSVPEGKIAINWRIAEEGDERTLVFEWRESGLTGLPSAPRRTGFGTELVQRTLAYELDATIDRQFNPSGVRYLIRLPMGEQTIKA